MRIPPLHSATARKSRKASAVPCPCPAAWPRLSIPAARFAATAVRPAPFARISCCARPDSNACNPQSPCREADDYAQVNRHRALHREDEVSRGEGRSHRRDFLAKTALVGTVLAVGPLSLAAVSDPPKEAKRERQELRRGENKMKTRKLGIRSLGNRVGVHEHQRQLRTSRRQDPGH
jgi:hypothetical protein